MQFDHGSYPDGGVRAIDALVDGLLQDGTDRSAAWRAHLRESTMARQAAELLYARTGSASDAPGERPPTPAGERVAVLRAELARIVADHRMWMRAHGIDEVEVPTRRRRSSAPTQQ